jgi:hypothetical protein
VQTTVLNAIVVNLMTVPSAGTLLRLKMELALVVTVSGTQGMVSVTKSPKTVVGQMTRPVLALTACLRST